MQFKCLYYLSLVIAGLCRGVEQLAARWAHNPKVVSSNLTPATNVKDAELVSFLLLWVICLAKRAYKELRGKREALRNQNERYRTGLFFIIAIQKTFPIVGKCFYLDNSVFSITLSFVIGSYFTLYLLYLGIA